MRVDRPGRRLNRLAGALAVFAITAGSAVFWPGSASAQTADLGLTKSVSPAIGAFPPNREFNFFLSYSCSSLSEPCTGARIVDVIPPQLSRAVADVSFGGNFADVQYDPATGTATFIMFDPLPAGTTAQVSIAAKFPPGTAPGTTATNQATMTATNASAVQSNPVTVRAVAASNYTVSKGFAPGTTVAQLGEPVSYRVGLTVAAGGTQDVNLARFVDTLPPGVQFVSASDGGTYNPANNTVTWNLGTIVPNPNADVTVTRTVTVIFNSPPFQAGDTPINLVVAFGTPSGGSEIELGRDDFQVTLRAPGDITSAGKRAGLATLGPGQIDTYTVTGSNPNPGPLDGFTLLDVLPIELTPAQTGGPNVTGTGNPPLSVGWRAGTTGGFTTVAVTDTGAGWSATVPAAAGQIQVSYGTVPVNFSASFQVRAGIAANGLNRTGQPIPPNAPIRNCVFVSATGAIQRAACTDQIVVPISVQFGKDRTSAPVVAPGGTVSWEMPVVVDANSASALVNPVITDCLPPDLDLANPDNPADPANGTATGFATPPVVTRTPNGCGNAQVLITWSWGAANPLTMNPGDSGTITLNSTVSLDAPPETVVNTARLSASNLTTEITRIAAVDITSATLLLGFKEVHGDLDPDFVGFETVGRASPGGTATYRATLANISQVPVTNLVVIDTMPRPGDTGVLFPVPRGSTWSPVFAGGFASEAPATISYSASYNPCRPELTSNTPGCQPANWTASPGATVGAIKVDFGSFVLPPGGGLRFSWNVVVPDNAPVQQVTWNSFAYAATRADNAEALVPSEPRKVGLEVFTDVPPPPEPPGISLIKFVNGIHAPNPPGPTIQPNAPVVFTYRVTNTGELTLVDIVLVDDELGVITCPRTTLAPGENMLCTSETQVAITGQYDNVATVTGQPVTPDGNPSGPPLTDTDRGHYTNGDLPDTGVETGQLVSIAGLMLLLGFGFLALSRRRQEAA
jgi:LPXTG-motif cell wall-anchored protein/uncharacterized repeat protein (TIGR01451 family)